MKSQHYLDFDIARLQVHLLGLKSHKQWRKHCLNKPGNDIPKSPCTVYKNKGWISWMDWLGYSYNGYWNRKYPINHNYFKKWTPNMSYVLGLWWTDGNIYGSRFNISQHNKDKYLLEQILSDMNSKHHVTTDNSISGKKISRIDIYCKELVKDIKRMGGIEKKSKKICFPEIPKEYLPDFIRGLWDGDGSVWQTKTSDVYCSNFASGSFKFINDFKKVLYKNIPNFHCKIYRNFHEKGLIICDVKCKKEIITYQISLGINDTIRLRNFMYSTVNEKSIKNSTKFLKFQQAGELRFLKREKDTTYLSFQKARKFVHSLKLSSFDEYLSYLKQHAVSFLPQNPRKRYQRCSQWVSLQDFLGIEIWEYNDAKNYVKKLNLKNIQEWFKYAKSSQKPPNLPVFPDNHYKKSGWTNWYDWLNKNKKATANII